MNLTGKSLGQYQILHEIGRGGMAVVYEAYQPSLGRSVAIKVLPPQYTFDATFVQRFLQEARAAARLEHPNIVSIYDVSEQNGVYYIVMQKLEGDSLHGLIQRSGRIPPSRAAQIVAQVAAALDFAHTRGFIHRDIKPANIIVDANDHATLTDFGIAKAVEGTKMTQTGIMMGTPEYMSPEQASGKTVGPASDIYALGIVLYQMLTGRVPFQADSTPALLYKQVYEPPAPARTYVPNLPPAMEQALDRALAKDPAARFRSAGEMAAALLAATGDRPPITGSLPTAVVPLQSSPPPRLASQTPAPQKRRTSWPLLAAVAVGLAAVAVLALTLNALRPGASSATPVVTEAVAVAPATPTNDPSAALVVQLAQAQDKIGAGAWHEALALVEGVRKADAGFRTGEVSEARFTACFNLAWQAERANDMAQAQNYWGCALEEHPNDGEAQEGRRRADLYLQAQAATAAADHAQAVAVWQELYDESPTNDEIASKLYEAHLAYGEALCRLGEVGASEKGRMQFTAAQELDFDRPEAGAGLNSCPLPGPHLAVVEVEDALRVRTGPGMGYLVLGKLVPSTQVTITGRTIDATWASIEAGPERVGWAASEFLTFELPIQAAAILPTPAPARRVLAAQAARDFSDKQGQHNWYYLMSTSPGAIPSKSLPWNAASGKWYHDPAIHPEMRLSNRGSFPSVYNDVARMWASPYQGVLHIFGQAAKESGAGRGGNGVSVRIMHNDQVLWEHFLDAYDTVGVTFDLAAEAAVGDKFYFITSALGDDYADNTIFEPSIELQNPNGVDQAEPTLWAEDAPTPATPAQAAQSTPPALCFQPKLRHYEPHKGCCAEVGGVVFNRQGQPFAPRGAVLRIEGPPAANRYIREFALAADGGYNVTALTVNPYTIWLKGPGIRSGQFAVTFPDLANIRELVDFFQAPC